MEHFYVLSKRALKYEQKLLPIIEFVGRANLDEWLSKHTDSFNDLLIGSWYDDNDVTVGGVISADDYLRYKL